MHLSSARCLLVFHKLKDKYFFHLMFIIALFTTLSIDYVQILFQEPGVWL